MYAIIKTGGKQYREDVITVEKLAGEPGDTVVISEVLMVADGDGVQIGSPFVDGASVACELVEQTRGPKIIIFKKKRRKHYRRKKGHRQDLTVLKVTEILTGGKKPSGKKATPKKAAKPAPAKAEKKADEEGGDDLSLLSGVGPVLVKKLLPPDRRADARAGEGARREAQPARPHRARGVDRAGEGAHGRQAAARQGGPEEGGEEGRLIPALPARLRCATPAARTAGEEGEVKRHTLEEQDNGSQEGRRFVPQRPRFRQQASRREEVRWRVRGAGHRGPGEVPHRHGRPQLRVGGAGGRLIRPSRNTRRTIRFRRSRRSSELLPSAFCIPEGAEKDCRNPHMKGLTNKARH